MSVIDEIAAERARQKAPKPEGLGFIDSYDDTTHAHGDLALVAALYATPLSLYQQVKYANGVQYTNPWPWGQYDDSRPHNGNVILPNSTLAFANRRRQLVKSAALVVAEIERLDRLGPEAYAAKEGEE